MSDININDLDDDELKNLMEKAETLEKVKKAHKRQKRKEKIENIKQSIVNGAQKVGHTIKINAQKAGAFLKEKGHNAKETLSEKWSAFRSEAKERYNQYVNAQMVIQDQESEIERLREEIHNLQNQLNEQDNKPIDLAKYKSGESDDVS
jgi:chromosome segregation ATPase